jgi:hypothetical protein
MNRKRAEEIGGKLSWPSKMDVVAWGIPATRCRVGSLLAQREGTTCSDYYAMKGTFRFKGVNQVLEDNFQKHFNEQWTPAMAAQLRWLGEERARPIFYLFHLRLFSRSCAGSARSGRACSWRGTSMAPTCC